MMLRTGCGRCCHLTTTTTATTTTSTARMLHFVGRVRSSTFPLSRQALVVVARSWRPSRRSSFSTSSSSSSTTTTTKQQQPSAMTSSSSSLFLSLQGWIRWYSAKLDTHPFLTMMVTSGLIAGGGDALCQFLVGMMEKSKGGGVVAAVVVPYDIWRTARFTLLGTVVVAPSVHAWYTVLNRVVSGVTVTAVVRRVAADQLVFSPVFLSLWLPSLWILEGDACNKDMAHRLVTCLPGVVVANWTLWVPAQVVNFRWIAPKYQVLFSNLTDLVWNVYLSYLNASGQEYKLEYDPTIHNS